MARQAIRDDPHTAEIAKALGVELEDYVEKVMSYVLDPGKEPELELLDDESVAMLGPEAPTVNDVVAWFDGVERGEIDLDPRLEIAEHDGFSTEAERSEALRARTRGEPVARPAAPTLEQISRGRRPAEPSDGAGAVLRNQLLEQQRNLQVSMEARKAGRPGPKPRSGGPSKR